MKRTLCLLLALLCLLSVPVLAFADGYTYTVRVFAGNVGNIGGAALYEQSGIPYDGEWSFDIGQVNVTNKKYYVRGIRESGLDNDTVSNPAFRVRQDMDFVVAYGVRGSEVAYTVSFVRDSDGETLAPSVTYYGNVGDKPVVACRFIDGYYPFYYNITGTLSENAALNQFVFRYAPVEVIVVDGGGGATVVPDQTNPRPAVPGQNRPQTEPQSEPQGQNVPPAPEEILDLDVPQASAQPGSAISQPGGLSRFLLIVLSVFGLLAMLFLLWFFLLRRKSDKEDGQ